MSLRISAYHAHRDEAQGAEATPTFYMNRRAEKPFHLDYVFLPNAWRERVRAVEVGSPADWLGMSDHMPILVDVAAGDREHLSI